MDLFPNGVTSYLLGGLLVGAGIGLIFIFTGVKAGASGVLTSTLSFVFRGGIFDRFRGERSWRLLVSLGLILGALLFHGHAGRTASEPHPGLALRGRRVSGRSWNEDGERLHLRSRDLRTFLVEGRLVAPRHALHGDRHPHGQRRSGASVMKKALIFLLGGIVFGFGLGLSGMAKPEVVLAFLLLEDFGLTLVMGGALLVTLPLFQLWKRGPILGGTQDSASSAVTLRPVLGSILFGIGWGLSGVCPGAAIASLGVLNTPILTAIACMFLGALCEGFLPRGNAK